MSHDYRFGNSDFVWKLESIGVNWGKLKKQVNAQINDKAR